MCDTSDIGASRWIGDRGLSPAAASSITFSVAGSECMSPLAVRDAPLRCVVFDSRAGGSGIVAAALREAPAVFAAALRLVEECPSRCDDGCPLCIFCDGCRESNVVLDKRATMAILRAAAQCVSG